MKFTKHILVAFSTLLIISNVKGASDAQASMQISASLENNSAVTSSIANEDDVVLYSRYNGGNYITATYSFKYMTQGDLEKTRNNWELLFESTRGGNGDDQFLVNTVVDDNSFIYDLGEKSCNDIKYSDSEDRKDRPLVWLAYSDAAPRNLKAERSIAVQIGHCYLTYNNDEDGRVVSLFHVKNHI